MPRYSQRAGNGQTEERESKRASHAMRKPTLSLLALLLAACTVLLSGQSVMPTPRQQYLDNNGDPCAGCLLYAYAAGTSTAQNTYTDVTLETPNANPVELDSAGRATVYLDTRLSYKFSLHTAADVPIWTVDNVDAVPSGNVSVEVTGIAGETLAARDTVYLSAGDDDEDAGEWYKTDADTTHKSSGASLVGVVISSVISDGNSGTIRIQGRVDGYTGLIQGQTYYVSATAGALTATAPGNVKVVGIAQSSGVLLLTPGVASSTDAGVFVTAQVTGTSADAFVLAGGMQTGTSGAIQMIDTTGKIPAIDSSRFTSLSGANLTAIPAAQVTGTLPAISGANLTTLNGSNISSGTVADARLSSNVPLKNAGNTFSGAQQTIQATTPTVRLIDSGSTANSQRWRLLAFNSGLFLQAMNDAESTTTNVLSAVQSGGTVSSIALGAPTTGTRINSGSAQPGFLAYFPTGTVLGLGGHTLTYTEIYDTASNFNAGTGEFTAPVTGVYLCSAQVNFVDAPTMRMRLVTSNRTYLQPFPTTEGVASLTVFADMDASDTASVSVDGGGAGFQVGGNDGSGRMTTFFSCRLMP